MRKLATIKTMIRVLAAYAVAAVAAGECAVAADEADLAQRSGCLACHRGVEQRIGPPFRSVAEKYAGQDGAESKLAEHIIKGTGPDGVGWMSAGKASQSFMPPNDGVSENDAHRLARWVLSVTAEIADPSRYVTEKITITGLVEHPLALTIDDLRQFPPQQVGEFSVVGQMGANRGKLQNFKGVRLKDILQRAVIVSKSRNDVKKMAIVATASDDYKVVFSWSEIFNSPLGEGVVVFFERDGKPLDDSEGRIAMISSKDIHTGPRHVKWLQGIEVRKIVE